MPHVVTGRVVRRSSDGVALEGATVLVEGVGVQPADAAGAKALTDRDGVFWASFVLAYVLSVSVRVQWRGVTIAAVTLDHSSDNEVSLLDFGDVIVPEETGVIDLPRATPVAPPLPRAGGRVVDAGGRCSFHCLQVIIEAIVDDETEFRPIGVGRTDRSGRFFVDYARVRVRQARAVIPGVPDPLLLHVTVEGLIAPDALLVVSLPAAEEAHDEDDCGCGSSGVPRIPSQDDLAASSATYSSDLGAGCTTFTTPNRAIEEYDFWTVVRTSQPAIRRTTAVDPAGFPVGRVIPGDADVRWDDDPELYQASTVAHGHLLHFRQTWFADGYSLGDLLYSLPLAPGQKKHISMVEWERSEGTARNESTQYTEGLRSTLTRDRDITEVISGALSERARGGSTSSTWGVGAGTGGAGNGSYQGFNFGALFGVSGGYSQADSSAWQDSSRNFASTSMNSLRDQVLQSASAVRGVRSTVVSTVGQSEAVRAETEVVANHNHCHALTIQYFEVLRHFQMRHELVEVKECVFVPLPITPFTGPKLLRWRDQIRGHLLRADLADALEALARVERNWADTPTPLGRYADESVRELTGEIDLEFQAYPPALPEPGSADAAATALQQSAAAAIASVLFPPLNVLLPVAIQSAASALTSGLKVAPSEQARWTKFHRDVMPRFAARFVNTLRLRVQRTDGTSVLVNGDFTLVSRYQPDRPLVVSWRATPAGFRRADIRALSVEAPGGVPDAVRCVVRALRADYLTDTFGHRLAQSSRLNDDLDGPRLVATGTFPAITFALDTSTADPVRTSTPLDSFELRSARADDRRLAQRLLDHVNANLEYYHHAIWWTMDPNRRYLLLDGFLAPNGGGRSLAQVVENRLIGIVGNSLVMPVAPGNRLDPSIVVRRTVRTGGAGEPTDAAAVADPTGLLAYYQPPIPVPPARVSLPTKGVFAEAVMGACNSCERIDESRFWRWEQSPIDEPVPIEPPSTASRRSEPEQAEPTSYPVPVVSIQSAPAAPAPTDTAGLFGLLGRAAFPDITGLAGTQANAAATYRQNIETALAYGKEASELAKQAGMLAAKDKILDSIDSAEKDGSISSKEAHDLRLKALTGIVGGGDTDDGISAAKRRLELVRETSESGDVGPEEARRLSGTILDQLARGDASGDPERDAAAKAIADLPPGTASAIEVTRGDDTTRVESTGGPTGPMGWLAEAVRTATMGAVPAPSGRVCCMLPDFIDPGSLGVHGSSGEKNGEIYTGAAGFIDTAHLREHADNTHYIHDQLLRMFAPGGDPTKPVRTLHGRATLSSSPPPAALLPLAQAIAYDDSFAYEIYTWTNMIVGGHNSSFSPEDLPSNWLGIVLAGRAIRGGGAFDVALTSELTKALTDLKAQTAAESQKAFELVKSVWFTPGEIKLSTRYLARRNFTHTPWKAGHASDVATPGYLASTPPEVDAARSLYVFEIPLVFEANISSKDFPSLEDKIRKEAEKTTGPRGYGPRYDKPD